MSSKLTSVNSPTFADRLKAACGTQEPAEIARRLGVSYVTVKNYLEGRLPAADVLITIARTTGVSLNWLLTGETDGEEPRKGRTYLLRAIKNDNYEYKMGLRTADLELALYAHPSADIPYQVRVVSSLAEALKKINKVVENHLNSRREEKGKSVERRGEQPPKVREERLEYKFGHNLNHLEIALYAPIHVEVPMEGLVTPLYNVLREIARFTRTASIDNAGVDVDDEIDIEHLDNES